MKKNKKQLPMAVPARPRDVVEVLCDPDTNTDDATARPMTRPEVNAAGTIQRFRGNNHEVNALIRELSAQVDAVNRGDLTRTEGMLISQAHTLDELFNSLARRAHGQEHLLQYETHFRLALKAQSQCRTTLETLALIKNPKAVAFFRQANIAAQMQVNNGVPAAQGK